MRKLTLVFLALFVTGMFSCQKEEMDSVKKSLDDLVQLDPQSGQIIEGQFVVVFDDNLKSSLDLTGLSYMSKLESVSAFAQKVLMDNGINEYELGNAYAEAIQGFSAKIGSKAVASLKKDSRVAYVLPDRMYIMRPPWETPDDPPAPEGQEVPYGIARVGYGDGTGKTAWIIDTGIDFEHEDLNVDASRGRNFIRTNKSADDDNGHGTHCAGTVAAIDNEIGVVGVAAGATVVPVKVLDRRGSGAYSVIIA